MLGRDEAEAPQRLKPKFHLARHVTSQHDTTRRVRRVEPLHFWLCRACRTARLDTLVSTRSTRRKCRVVSRRDVTTQVEFGLKVERTNRLSGLGEIAVACAACKSSGLSHNWTTEDQ